MGTGGKTWNSTNEVSEIGLVSSEGKTGTGQGGSCPCTAPQAADCVAVRLAIEQYSRCPGRNRDRLSFLLS